MGSPYFSIVVPTFNRPDEVEELIASLARQANRDFELILADGSPTRILAGIVDKYKEQIPILHLHQPYLGISESRNLGCQHGRGEYFIFFDSDCVIPPHYLDTVAENIRLKGLDAFGGPDAADNSFTPLQKAISYSMTSMLTTGGIRGKKKHVGPYHPRGFNMGVSRKVFEKTGGYSTLKCAEDIEFSIRIINQGFKTELIPGAYVYHKRRTTFWAFFRQVFRFGAARINIYRLYPDQLKLVHFFPALFLTGLLFCMVAPLINTHLALVCLAMLVLYGIAILVDSTIRNGSIRVGLLSIMAVLVQFAGYGSGFVGNAFQLLVLRRRKPLV